MKHKRLLTKEEMEFINEINFFTARKLDANSFRKLNDIRNECLGTRLRAVIGCGGCARQLKQHLQEIYLLTEEHFKQEEDAAKKRTKRKPRRTTKRSTEQSNSGSEGSIQETGDDQPSSDAEVVKRGSSRRPRKSDRPSTENE